jgi:glycosyltransferase involved in cell wall biosynthesis
MIIRRLPSLNVYHSGPDELDLRLPVLGFRAALFSIIADSNIDLIHSHNIHHPHGPGLATIVSECAQATGTPHVTTVHDVGNVNPSDAERKAVSHALNQAFCIVTSQFNQALLRTSYGIVASTLIPPGTDFDFLQPASGAPEPLTICYPGRLKPGKGAVQAITLLSMLSDEIGPITLLLSDRSSGSFGESGAFLDALDALIDKCSTVKCEFLHGPGVIPAIYSRACLCLAMPHSPEGFGLTPLESIACGRPVVATPTGGMNWTVDVPGILSIPHGNMFAVAEAIATVLSDWPSWHFAAKQGRRDLQRQYDIKQIARQHALLYDRLLHSYHI